MSLSAGWDGSLEDHLLWLCFCPPYPLLSLPWDDWGALSLGHTPMLLLCPQWGICPRLWRMS